MGTAYRPCLLPKRRTFIPSDAHIAEFVERLRASDWLPKNERAVRGRMPQRLHVTGARGDKIAPDGVPIATPVTPSLVSSLRKPDATSPLEDEMRFAFDVDWDFAASFDDEEESDDHDGAEASPIVVAMRPILALEKREHPRFYKIELWIARDLVKVWGNNVHIEA